MFVQNLFLLVGYLEFKRTVINNCRRGCLMYDLTTKHVCMHITIIAPYICTGQKGDPGDLYRQGLRCELIYTIT